jgi:hypothetical protein
VAGSVDPLQVIEQELAHSARAPRSPRTPSCLFLCSVKHPLPQSLTTSFGGPPGERRAESSPEGSLVQSVSYRSLPLTSRASPRGVTTSPSPDAPQAASCPSAPQVYKKVFPQPQLCFLILKPSLFPPLPALRAAPSWLLSITPPAPLLRAPWAVPAAVAIPLAPPRAVAATPAVRSWALLRHLASP